MAFPLLFSGFLAAMQAAGAIIDYNTTKHSQGLINKGRELENAAFNTNLEAIKTESEEQSLMEMQQLRKNIGTQIATNAARGNNSGQGSSILGIQSSISNANADERARRINLLSKEANLRASNVLSGLHTAQSETELGQKMTSRLFNSIPASGLFDAFAGSPLGKKWGFGLGEVK